LHLCPTKDTTYPLMQQVPHVQFGRASVKAFFFAIAFVVPGDSLWTAPALQQVQKLRTKLARVLHTPGLPSDLKAEALHVDADAANAVTDNANATKASNAVLEYQTFLRHVMNYQKHLKFASGTALSHPHSQESKTGANGSNGLVFHMEATLESRVKKLLLHLRADQSPSASDVREKLISRLQTSLEESTSDSSGNKSTAALNHVISMHEALSAAEPYLTNQTKKLSAEQANLAKQLEREQARMLYVMLKQRRTLPLKTQLAMLHRHQFANNKFAQRLLRTHKDRVPLCNQLLALLPPALLKEVTDKPTSKMGHLVAAGSGGRVHIIDSRVKNEVNAMLHVLVKGKTAIAELLKKSPDSMNKDQQQQAKHVMEGLDKILSTANGTHDLAEELDGMYAAQKQVEQWMRNMTML